ncbi:MAG TPA: hypothetical protein VHV83_17935 [Armatimonadota bacterium]|nr:hypothetical protein [Armatimonadota bacterium]
MELVSPSLVNIIALLAISTGLVVTAWWVIALYGVHSRKDEKELPEIDLPAHLHEILSGIPPALMAFYIFTGITLVAYVISVWVAGVSY